MDTQTRLAIFSLYMGGDIVISGQKFELTSVNTQSGMVGGISKNEPFSFKETKVEHAKILVTNLLRITDEDALVAAKISGYTDRVMRKEVIKFMHDALWGLRNDIHIPVQAYQHLYSKRYAFGYGIYSVADLLRENVYSL